MVAPPEIPTAAELRAARAHKAAERASATALTFDVLFPGWSRRLDPASLDISSQRACVGAQMIDFGLVDSRQAFVDAMSELLPIGDDEARWWFDRGLAGPPDDLWEPRDREWYLADLTAAWRREIARRTHPARREVIDAETAAWEARVNAPDGYATRLRARTDEARALAAELGLDIELEDTAEEELGSGSIPGALPMPDPGRRTAPPETPATKARIEVPTVAPLAAAAEGERVLAFGFGVAIAAVVFGIGALADWAIR